MNFNDQDGPTRLETENEDLSGPQGCEGSEVLHAEHHVMRFAESQTRCGKFFTDSESRVASARRVRSVGDGEWAVKSSVEEFFEAYKK